MTAAEERESDAATGAELKNSDEEDDIDRLLQEAQRPVEARYSSCNPIPCAIHSAT